MESVIWIGVVGIWAIVTTICTTNALYRKLRDRRRRPVDPKE